MVAVDRSSRWIVAIPMKDNTTQCLLDALLQLLQTRGTPEFLFSDRGGNLLSLLAMQVYNRLGIEKVSMAPYLHNASGLVERAIQSLLQFLTCNVAGMEHHALWNARLPWVVWTMNTSVCAGKGYTPFYLEHGRQARTFDDRALDTNGVATVHGPWVETLKQRLTLAHAVRATFED